MLLVRKQRPQQQIEKLVRSKDTSFGKATTA